MLFYISFCYDTQHCNKQINNKLNWDVYYDNKLELQG